MSDAADGGVQESMDATARTALMVAMQLGEKFARLREEMMRDAERRSAAESRELAARFEAERGRATGQLAVVERPDWWENATIREVASVAETAQTWRGVDEGAARASEVIRDQVQERYGVDVDQLIRDVRALPPEPTEVDRAREWASSDQTPEYYRRGEDEYLTRAGEGGAIASGVAQAALVEDFRYAQTAGVAPDLSLAEEWARSSNPAAYEQYVADTRRETLAVDADSGDTVIRSHTPEDIAQARAALLETWQQEAPGQRVDADRERTEAVQLIALADQLDRANVPADQRTSDERPEDIVARLEQQARQYDADAAAGGSVIATPDELRELASDARSQADLHRHDVDPATAAAAPAESGRSAEATGARADAGNLYDSAQRRDALAAHLETTGASAEDIRARMRADMDQGRPPQDAVRRKTTFPAQNTPATPVPTRTRDRGGPTR